MDNEKAIKILRKGYPDINRYAASELESYEYDVDTYNEAVGYAISHLEEDRWIPVSERLPEEKQIPLSGDFGFDFEEVLCTTIWGSVRAYKFGKPIGHDKPHFWNGGGIMDEYVIAWQYKPDPYKKGGKE